MCIRDRIATLGELFSREAALIMLENGEQVLTELIAKGIIAVSYTHLRAHETVLDLVCRLLLEKQNTTQKDHPNTVLT